MNNDDLPSAGADPFSSTPAQNNSPRSGSCLSWGLILTGGLLTVFGFLMAISGTYIQFDQQNDWAGFYGFLCLCPLPLALVGIIILIFGATPLLKKGQIENTLSE